MFLGIEGLVDDGKRKWVILQRQDCLGGVDGMNIEVPLSTLGDDITEDIG